MRTYGEFISICEQVSAYGQLRYGSTSARATDKSVSSAVDRALSNPSVSQSASSEKGKTGVTGSVDVQYSGRLGSRSKPQSTTPGTKPQSTKPEPKPKLSKPPTVTRVFSKSVNDKTPARTRPLGYRQSMSATPGRNATR